MSDDAPQHTSTLGLDSTEGRDPFDKGSEGEGVSAREAGKRLGEKWRRHDNEHVDRYLRGQMIDEIKLPDNAEKIAPPKNPNIKGVDIKAVVNALERHREGREIQIRGELAQNYGLEPDGSPLQPRQSDPAEQSDAQPQWTGTEHPAVAEAKAQAAAQYAHAQNSHIAAASMLVHTALPELSEFQNFSTQDIAWLAQNDPVRYARWESGAQKFAAGLQQMQAVQQQQQAHFQQHYAPAEDAKFAARFPEVMRDPASRAKAADAAFSTLKAAGFNEAELAQSWNQGQLRDHRVQTLVHKAALYDAAVAQGRRPAPRPVPTVQRPGVARPRGASDAVQHFTEKFHRSGKIGDGARALAARWRSQE